MGRSLALQPWGLWSPARMPSPQDHDAELLKQGGLAALLIRRKESMLERFCERAQQSLPNARREPHPVIIDTLPAFITRIALAVQGLHAQDYASRDGNLALQHGNERARFTGYSLGELLKEYQFLREILVDTVLAEAAPTNVEWRVIHRSVDEAMAEAATAFIEVHEAFREAFTASLAHDFRGPLSTASNYLELMRREPDGAVRETIARRVSANLQRIARMIGGLLDASRSNAGERLALEPARFAVRGLLEEVIADLDSHQRQLVRLDMPESFEAFWDRDKVHRALHNLLDNALKYSTPQSVITLRAVTTHGRAQISVHNTGNPISKEDHESLFKPYRRTTQAQISGKVGWGLGLVQVEAIAEAHGGAVGVESSPADGTTFTFDLILDVSDLRDR
jgi:signal transduction histidine kinase